ncbi:MAG: hypothetical protein RL885_03285 [Planctomycetota bacterium]
MHSCMIRSGVIATSLCFAMTAAAVAQDSVQDATKRRVQSTQSQTDLDSVKDAYKQLHDAATKVLNDEARQWGQKGDSGKRDAEATGQREGQATGKSTMGSLDENELLIAACSKGLIAGAPTQYSMSPQRRLERAGNRNEDSGRSGQNGQDGQDDRDDATSSRQNTMSGEQIGLMILCASEKGNSSLGAQSARAEKIQPEIAGDRGGNSSMGGKLKPGVYAVMQSNRSVWLQDENGREFLKTTVHNRNESHEKDSGRDLGQEETGREDRPRLGSNDADQPGWKRVFETIAEKAVVSLGWTERQGGSAGN